LNAKNKRAAITAMTAPEKSKLSIGSVAYEVGFNNPTYFSKVFKIKMEISPEVYRRENQTNFHF